MLRPFPNFELDLDARRVHVFFPDLIELARGRVGRGGVLQHQRLAVGQITPAVAISVNIAIHVKQCSRPCRVVFAHFRLEFGIVTKGAWLNRALRGNGLVAPGQANLFISVVGQRNGAPQGDLFGRVAAHQRVFHVEVGHRDIRDRHALHGDVLFGKIRSDLVIGNCLVGKGVGQALQQVLIIAQERQPARLHFFNNGHLHPVNHRQLFTLHLRVDGLRLGVIRRGLCLVKHVAVIGVFDKHHFRRARPLAQHKRTRAYRMLHDLVAVFLDHLTRYGTLGARVGQAVDESMPNFLCAELNCVAIKRSQTWHLFVVIELRAGLFGSGAQLGHTYQPLFLHIRVCGAFIDRVKEPLVRVDHVLRGQLTFLAPKSGIVRKVDARFDLDGVGSKIIAEDGHALSQNRFYLDRAGQVVILVERLKHVASGDAGIEV